VAEEIQYRESEALYNEPNVANVIKSCRLWWAMYEWMKMNYLKIYCGHTLEVTENMAN
jgi:hypothetical protein